ncbi:hypothetical protein BpHYR1_006000 [Brachionus plicatilis]|uniref:Uncharacterized protein n=1 Tax=Brachionus plicatilis TaxID=10195 RepID=A0A3M7SWZ8_BRAPC|nr:hypothetical protein BpHYR1_006000 [Brachionus plicatilis]
MYYKLRSFGNSVQIFVCYQTCYFKLAWDTSVIFVKLFLVSGPVLKKIKKRKTINSLRIFYLKKIKYMLFLDIVKFALKDQIMLCELWQLIHALYHKYTDSEKLRKAKFYLDFSSGKCSALFFQVFRRTKHTKEKIKKVKNRINFLFKSDFGLKS